MSRRLDLRRRRIPVGAVVRWGSNGRCKRARIGRIANLRKSSSANRARAKLAKANRRRKRSSTNTVQTVQRVTAGLRPMQTVAGAKGPARPGNVRGESRWGREGGRDDVKDEVAPPVGLVVGCGPTGGARVSRLAPPSLHTCGAPDRCCAAAEARGREESVGERDFEGRPPERGSGGRGAAWGGTPAPRQGLWPKPLCESNRCGRIRCANPVCESRVRIPCVYRGVRIRSGPFWRSLCLRETPAAPPPQKICYLFYSHLFARSYSRIYCTHTGQGSSAGFRLLSCPYCRLVVWGLSGKGWVCVCGERALRAREERRAVRCRRQ